MYTMEMERDFDVTAEIKKAVKQYEQGFLTLNEMFKRIDDAKLSEFIRTH